MWLPPGFDPDRWTRVLSGSHKATVRMEVWADGVMQSESAPLLSGMATEDWATGPRWSLSCTVPPTRAWRRWLDGPVELRPYRGVQVSRSVTWEAPLGRYLVLPPERTLPQGPISISVDDYWQWVSSAKYAGPVMSPPGEIARAIAQVMAEAGLAGVDIRSTNHRSAGSVLIDKQRDEWVIGAARSISAEAYVDRDGTPVVVDSPRLGAPTSRALTGDGGTAVGVRRTPDWPRVYNTVAASSSATDVDLPTEWVSITLPSHPAHPARIGTPSRPNYRVYTYSSPLLRTTEQIKQAAQTLLERVSSTAEQYSYECIPDPLRGAGDTMLGQAITGTQLVQMQSVGHPLTIGEAQPITAVSTRVDDDA